VACRADRSRETRGAPRGYSKTDLEDWRARRLAAIWAGKRTNQRVIGVIVPAGPGKGEGKCCTVSEATQGQSRTSSRLGEFSEVATIAKVSIKDGDIVVHDVWVAIDPGRIVNPAIIEAQVNSAVALGLSSALLEELVYVDGVPRARNFDTYPILPPSRMPRVHVRIIESGAPMGGIGEPGVPGVPPAVVNAVRRVDRPAHPEPSLVQSQIWRHGLTEHERVFCRLLPAA
jgi:CO/xanthine dehydrogenase Mo-binding subunit